MDNDGERDKHRARQKERGTEREIDKTYTSRYHMKCKGFKTRIQGNKIQKKSKLILQSIF